MTPPSPAPPAFRERLPLTAGWSLLRRFRPYLRPARGKTIAIACLLCFSIPSGVVAPLLVKRIFDHSIKERDARELVLLGAAVIGLVLLSQALRFVQGLLAMSIHNGVRYRVTRDLFGHVLRLPLAFLRKTETGYLMSRVRDDVASLDAVMTDTFVEAGADLLRAVLYFGALLWLDLGLALSGLALVAVIFGAVFAMSKPLRRRAERMRESDARSSAALQEALAGVATVRAAAREPTEVARFARSVRDSVRASARHDLLALATHSGISLVGVLGAYGIVCVGAWRVMHDLSSYGGLLAFSLYIMQFVGASGAVVGLNARLQRAFAALQRIFELLDRDAEPKRATPMPRLKGEVEFDAVSFAYDETAPALSGISFRAAPGEVIALVGRSGAGKSTLVALLSRLFEPTRGEIRVDGLPLASYPVRGLRAQIGVVPQDVFLFNRTIRENLVFARPDATEEALRAAARAAHAADFVERLPAGYETAVGERGVRLSGGEKQRLAIAREILRDPPILVLDEATSSLDSESEALIRDAIEELKRHRTCFVIAHRLSTVVSADRILVLDRGRIVESGRHADLLARGGLYRELYETQFRSALRAGGAEPLALERAPGGTG